MSRQDATAHWRASFRDAEKRLAVLNTVLGTFAGLLEAEWYNGNLDTKAYERLNADLNGIRVKYIGPIGAPTSLDKP